MSHPTDPVLVAALLLLPVLSLGCGAETASVTGASSGLSDHEAEAAELARSRIAIPAAVRRNLGITFATAEVRAVKDMLRIPGSFEVLPSARRDYLTPVAGQVELLASELESVELNQPLYRLTSPGLHDLQQKLAETETAIGQLQSELAAFEELNAAHAEHEARLQESITVQEARVKQLEKLGEAGAGQASRLVDAQAALAAARALYAGAREKEVELHIAHDKRGLEVEGLRSLKSILLGSLASDTGLTREALLAPKSEASGKEAPRWKSLAEILIRAQRPGRVASLDVTSGSWAEEGTRILSVIDPTQLRFHGRALQSDAEGLVEGMEVALIPAGGGARGEPLRGHLRLGLGGDAQSRTLDVFVEPLDTRPWATWARPGVASEVEIVLAAGAATSVAIPLAAVRQDGLDKVLFRRNPKKPSEVLRVEPTLGVSDGRWIEVLSGVEAGDEVVLDGSFQLLLSGGGDTREQGGHFHADGTFHEDDH